MGIRDYKKLENSFTKFDSLQSQEDIKEEVLDAFILQLNNTDLDSESSRKIKIYRKLVSVVSFIIGLIIIVTGLAVIIIPIPKTYEIQTLIYFNPEDGLTISDLFALALILLGNLFIYNSFKK